MSKRNEPATESQMKGALKHRPSQQLGQNPTAQLPASIELPETIMIECSRANAVEGLNPQNDTFTTTIPPVRLEVGDRITMSSAYIECLGADQDIISFEASGSKQNNKHRLTYEFYVSDDCTNDKKSQYWLERMKDGEIDVGSSYKPCRLYRWDRLMMRTTNWSNGNLATGNAVNDGVNLGKPNDGMNYDEGIPASYELFNQEDFYQPGVFYWKDQLELPAAKVSFDYNLPIIPMVDFIIYEVAPNDDYDHYTVRLSLRSQINEATNEFIGNPSPLRLFVKGSSVCLFIRFKDNFNGGIYHTNAHFITLSSLGKSIAGNYLVEDVILNDTTQEILLGGTCDTLVLDGRTWRLDPAVVGIWNSRTYMQLGAATEKTAFLFQLPLYQRRDWEFVTNQATPLNHQDYWALATQPFSAWMDHFTPTTHTLCWYGDIIPSGLSAQRNTLADGSPMPADVFYLWKLQVNGDKYDPPLNQTAQGGTNADWLKAKYNTHRHSDIEDGSFYTKERVKVTATGFNCIAEFTGAGFNNNKGRVLVTNNSIDENSTFLQFSKAVVSATNLAELPFGCLAIINFRRFDNAGFNEEFIMLGEFYESPDTLNWRVTITARDLWNAPLTEAEYQAGDSYRDAARWGYEKYDGNTIVHVAWYDDPIKAFATTNLEWDLDNTDYLPITKKHSFYGTNDETYTTLLAEHTGLGELSIDRYSKGSIYFMGKDKLQNNQVNRTTHPINRLNNLLTNSLAYSMGYKEYLLATYENRFIIEDLNAITQYSIGATYQDHEDTLYYPENTHASYGNVVHQHHLDIEADKTFMSPSDIGGEWTNKFHALTNFIDYGGTRLEVLDTIGKGINRNKLVIPVFGYNGANNTIATDGTINADLVTYPLTAGFKQGSMKCKGYSETGGICKVVEADRTKTTIHTKTLIDIGVKQPNGYDLYFRSQHIPIRVQAEEDSVGYGAARPTMAPTTHTFGSPSVTKTETAYDRFSTMYPFQYIDDYPNALISQFVGTDNMTLSYNTDLSLFEFSFLHQPYTSPFVDGVGGDNSAQIHYPAYSFVDNWTRYGGINIINWASPEYESGVFRFQDVYQNRKDFFGFSLGIDILSGETHSEIGKRFMNKLGFSDFVMSSKSGSNFTPATFKYEPIGTTTYDIDSSFAVLENTLAAENEPLFASDIFYPMSINTTSEKFNPADEIQFGKALYRFGSEGGERINNHSKGMGTPVTTGAPLTINSTTLPQTHNPDNEQYSGYTVAVQSSVVSATQLPTKLEYPYFLLLSDIIDSPQYCITAHGGSFVNVVSTIYRMYVAGDFYTNFSSSNSIYVTAPRTLSSITCSIRTPSLEVPTNIGENCTIIFQIDRERKPVPVAPATYEEIQERDYAVMDLINSHLSKEGGQHATSILDQVEALAQDILTPSQEQAQNIATIQHTLNNYNVASLPAPARSEFFASPVGRSLMNLVAQSRTLQGLLHTRQITSNRADVNRRIYYTGLDLHQQSGGLIGHEYDLQGEQADEYLGQLSHDSMMVVRGAADGEGGYYEDEVYPTPADQTISQLLRGQLQFQEPILAQEQHTGERILEQTLAPMGHERIRPVEAPSQLQLAVRRPPPQIVSQMIQEHERQRPGRRRGVRDRTARFRPTRAEHTEASEIVDLRDDLTTHARQTLRRRLSRHLGLTRIFGDIQTGLTPHIMQNPQYSRHSTILAQAIPGAPHHHGIIAEHRHRRHLQQQAQQEALEEEGME